MVTNQPRQSYNMEKQKQHFTLNISLHLIFPQFLNIVFQCGEVPQVWFSSQENIFHSNRSHTLTGLLFDHRLLLGNDKCDCIENDHINF